MKRGVFILLEGFDGVGKTTLAERIANRLSYEYHKSPEGIFSNARSYFDNENTNFVDRLSFYSSVALRNSITTEKLSSKGISVVMDRYYHSLIAYHFDEYMNLPENLKEIYKLLFQPDLIFCIELDYATIISRQQSSGRPVTQDDKIFVKEDLYKSISGIYRNILPDNTIYVENTGTVEQTQKIIIDAINKYNNRVRANF